MSTNEALSRGYPVIGITTGGKLSTVLGSKGVPVILVPKASAPRYGLPAYYTQRWWCLRGLALHQ